MSYYFTIIGTKDNPLFEHEIGTSKHGGDGVSRFRDDARHMNQFIVHSSLDIVEEVQWSSGLMYLKCIDRFQNAYIHAFLTPTNMKFLLLHNPDPSAPAITASGAPSAATAGGAPPSSSSSSHTAADRRASAMPAAGASSSSSASGTAAVPTNPLSPAAEEAVRSFFTEVYECWCKAAMSPFYALDQEIRSPVFRARVAASGRKYL